VGDVGGQTSNAHRMGPKYVGYPRFNPLCRTDPYVGGRHELGGMESGGWRGAGRAWRAQDRRVRTGPGESGPFGAAAGHSAGSIPRDRSAAAAGKPEFRRPQPRLNQKRKVLALRLPQPVPVQVPAGAQRYLAGDRRLARPPRGMGIDTIKPGRATSAEPPFAGLHLQTGRGDGCGPTSLSARQGGLLHSLGETTTNGAAKFK